MFRRRERSPRLGLSWDSHPGDEHTIADWGQITDYFQRLDKASDRVLVQTIGETTLKRPIIVAVISARENILALDKYKEIQRRLSDPRLVTSEQERDRLIQDGKVVVTISCSIHSTEIVASQMSMALAYELATAQDAETRAILQNTILLLIPSANPDGVDIVANWYRKTLGTPFEGKEPPELYHHYAGHDDNRDWFMLNLKETKAITRLFWQEWFPRSFTTFTSKAQTARGFLSRPSMIRRIRTSHRRCCGRLVCLAIRLRPILKPRTTVACSPTPSTTPGGTAAFALRPTFIIQSEYPD